MARTSWVYRLLPAVAFVAVLAPFTVARRVDDWLERRGAARAEIARVQAENAVLTARAHEWQAAYEAFRAERATRDTVLQTRIIRVQAVPVPVDCEPVTAPRDSIITELRQDNGRLASRLDAEIQHSAELLAGLEATAPVLDTASAVLRDAPVRPSLWQRLKPEIRLGVGVGVTYALDEPERPVRERFHVGPNLSVSASWRVW